MLKDALYCGFHFFILGFTTNPAGGTVLGNKPAIGGLGTGLGSSFGTGTRVARARVYFHCKFILRSGLDPLAGLFGNPLAQEYIK